MRENKETPGDSRGSKETCSNESFKTNDTTSLPKNKDLPAKNDEKISHHGAIVGENCSPVNKNIEDCGNKSSIFPENPTESEKAGYFQGNVYNPSRELTSADYLAQFADFMRAMGVIPPDQIIADGEIQRCDTMAKNGKTDASYLLHLDGIPAGYCENLQTGNKQRWCANIGRDLTPAEREANAVRVRESQRRFREKEAAKHAKAADKAEQIYDAAKPATADHPYLVRKGVKPHGVKVSADGRLIIPLYDELGEIRSIQFIGEDGSKRFLTGGKKGGCFYLINGKSCGVVCIAEGYATAASIYEATGYPVIVAFDTGNLLHAAKFAKQKYADAKIIICADDDFKTKGNPGATKANEAAEAINATVAVPTFASEGRQSNHVDFNDLHKLSGLDAVKDCVDGADKPAKSSHNAILDSESRYVKVNLLKHLPGTHVLRQMAEHVASDAQMPVSTTALVGLSVFSSVAARYAYVRYRNGGALPIGIYAVLEQPPGSGKSRCINEFKKPFEDIYEEVFAELYAELKEHEKNNETEKAEELNEKLNNLRRSPLFITNATAESLDGVLTATRGYFGAVASEQGLFNSLLGLSYTSDKSAPNNDTVLNGFDGGRVTTLRVSRQGFCGSVVGAITCFAQDGGVEKVLSASNGTGLAERFLMLVEPHNLGGRDFLIENEEPEPYWLRSKYASKCLFLKEIIDSPKPFRELRALELTAEGYRKINMYRQKIEPRLADGGIFSHIAIRGAAAKVDMQILKISANLHLLSDQSADDIISNELVDSAIGMADCLLNSSLQICMNKSLVGDKANFGTILKQFENRQPGAVITEREIIQSRSRVSPFKDYTGNKSEMIRKTLNDMIETGLIDISHKNGATGYSLLR